MPKITDLTSFEGTLSDTDVFPVVNSSITKKIPLSALRSNVLFGAVIPGSAIADQGITTAKIADQGITTAKIADQGITAAKIANSAVTSAKVDTTQVAVLGTAQEYTRAHNFNATPLTDGSTISWNLAENQVAIVTLGGNRALSNPTNMAEGAVYILVIKQDGNGSRTLSFDSDYKFPGNVAPTLSLFPNTIDIFTFLCVGTKLYGVYSQQYS